MTIITLTNDFHNTSVKLKMKSAYPSAYQVKRARMTLCGVKGCTCSGIMGMRGKQAVKTLGHEYLDGELVPGFVL